MMETILHLNRLCRAGRRVDTSLDTDTHADPRASDHSFPCELIVIFLDYDFDREDRASVFGRHDDMTTWLTRELGRGFVRMRSDIEQAREALGSFALDVLLFAELGMDFNSFALSFSRLAPLQVISSPPRLYVRYIDLTVKP